jgi:energy-coupling factor transporter ATP-binding protein EcfA2
MATQQKAKVYEVVLEKYVTRQVAAETLREQLTYIQTRAISGDRRGKWFPVGRFSVGQSEEPDGWRYTCKLRFHRLARKTSSDTEEAQFAFMRDTIIPQAGNSSGWGLEGTEKKLYATVQPEQATAVVHPDQEDVFAEIYGRDPQIARVQASIDTAVQTNFTERHHVLLWGPPGCGKTKLLLAFAKRLGGSDAVLKLDATSLTQAGAEQEIISSAKLPRFLILEEVEKTVPENLRWLIPVLDERGEIVKTNARINIRKDAKMLCLATVNNIRLFNKVLAGALSSRFSSKIYCPPPDRVTLEKVLSDKIRKMHGNPDWIKPTLDYCEARKMTDPRDVISICLCGKDSLLDGTYQAHLDATKGPEEGQFHEQVPAEDPVGKLVAAIEALKKS